MHGGGEDCHMLVAIKVYVKEKVKRLTVEECMEVREEYPICVQSHCTQIGHSSRTCILTTQRG